MTYTDTAYARPRGLYRSRNGAIFGVCRGLALYFELPVWAVRLLAIFAAFLTGIWPMVLLYLIAAIFMKPAPTQAPHDEDGWEFYNSYVTDRRMALSRLKRKFDTLEKRTRRMEAIVTDREYDWDRRFSQS